MAVAFVQGIGTATSATGGQTLTLTTTQAVAAGHTIIVTGHTRLTNTPASFTMSGGGLTWNSAIFTTRSGNVLSVAISYASCPTGLATSTNLLGTWDVAPGRTSMSAIEVSGVQSASPLDKTSVDTSAAGSPMNTNATTATAQADEFAVAAWCMAAAATGVTGTAGTQTGTATGATVTEFWDNDLAASSELYAYGEYQVLTGTGTCQLTMTPTATGAYCSVIATFKGGVVNITQALSASATSSTTLQRSIGKILSPAVTTSTTIQRAVAKTLSPAVTTSTTLGRAIAKTLSPAVTTTTTLGRQTGKTLSMSATSATTLGRSIGKPLAVAVTTSTTMARTIAKTLSIPVTVSASAGRGIAKLLTTSATGAASLLKGKISFITGLFTDSPKGSTTDTPTSQGFTNKPKSDVE